MAVCVGSRSLFTLLVVVFLSAVAVGDGGGGCDLRTDITA
jgi:hypothetical protein